MKKSEHASHKIPDLLKEQQILHEVDTQIWKTRDITEIDLEERNAILSDNERILKQVPPEEFTKRVIEKSGDGNDSSRKGARLFTFRRFPVLVTAAACTAIAGLLLFGPLQQSPPVQTAQDTIRLKGAELRLQIFRQTADEESEALSPGSTVHPGDQLQIAYRSMGPQYGLIASVDGSGHVSLHYPASIFDDPQLEIGSQQFLPYAFRLDSAPSHEQFLMIVSDEPFSVQETLRWIQENLNDDNTLPEETDPPFADGILRFMTQKERP
ncbi:MAG: hypothetical protein ACOCVC_09110 [Spirochaeta sp.]